VDEGEVVDGSPVVSGCEAPEVLELVGAALDAVSPDDAFHARWAEQLDCDAEALADRLWSGSEWGLAETGDIDPADCYAAVAKRLDVAPELVAEIATQAFASSPDEPLAEVVVTLRRRGVRTAALGWRAIQFRSTDQALVDLAATFARPK
jgi:hypothetical protein